MAKFRGYSLIRLNKAVGNEDVSTKTDYEVTIHNSVGTVTNQVLKLSQIEREWCKLRMKGDRFAMMLGGVVTPISEEEYNAKANPEQETES